MTHHSNAEAFFQTYPAAKDVYATTKLFHRTHSQYLEQILADGLRPQEALFPEEQGVFLQDMYAKYGRGVRHESDAIRDRIRRADYVYLSTEVPSLLGYQCYGIPERLVYLALGMKALAQKASLSRAEREYAQETYQAHYQRLTDDGAEILALEIDPLSPAVIEARIGGMVMEDIADESEATWLMSYVDNWPHNIPVPAVEPTYLSVYDRAPLIIENTALGASRREQSWLSDIA